MSLIKSWLIGISCCAILISLVKGVMPNGSVKKTAGLLCGVILLIVTVSPLLSLDFSALSSYTVEYKNAVGAYSADVAEVNERLAQVIIEEQSAAYILDKATGIGAEIQVEVTTRRGDGDYWYPYSVEIKGDYTEEQREELAETIERELAVPEERQDWMN